MDIRAQVSMVFHLDKCIGCHTCSIACKNIWTDRKGTEYMYWNNVETKPGTGYPTRWEDQNKYRGGWMVDGKKEKSLRLRLQGKWGTLSNIFYNPDLPTLDDYFEPWTYDYQNLFNAPLGEHQPTARAISMVTGKYMDTIEAGPNWDDDLGGSQVYANNDPNFDGATDEEMRQINEINNTVFFYLPRICNHCLNPGCVAACPQGAIYKRGEDGVVLVSQERCRAWRMCVSGCPYKKTYFNWSTGKAEKCILCYPRLESGQPPACFHSCVGRIRYIGLVLYDADLIEETAMAPQDQLVLAQRNIIKDPFDPAVIASAKANGIPDSKITAAQHSPVYQFVKKCGTRAAAASGVPYPADAVLRAAAGPVLAKVENGVYDNVAAEASLGPLMSSLERSRIPLRYMASLLSGGNEEIIRDVYKQAGRGARVHAFEEGQGYSGGGSATRARPQARLPRPRSRRSGGSPRCPPSKSASWFRPMERDTAVESAVPVARSGVAQLPGPQGRGWCRLPHGSCPRAIRLSITRRPGRVPDFGSRPYLAQLPASHRRGRHMLCTSESLEPMSRFSHRAQVLYTQRAKLLGLFADILDYPAPGLARKAAECAALVGGVQPQAAKLLQSFQDFAERHPLGKLQEVYSGFFDLNSICHPYVGYQLFGENYKRSIFLVGLKKSYRAEGFEASPDEIPDRLSVVLRYTSESTERRCRRPVGQGSVAGARTHDHQARNRQPSAWARRYRRRYRHRAPEARRARSAQADQ